MARKNARTKKHFPLPLLVLLLDPGSRIRDSASVMDKIQDPGSGISIPHPHHCLEEIICESVKVG